MVAALGAASVSCEDQTYNEIEKTVMEDSPVTGDGSGEDDKSKPGGDE